MKKRKSNQRRYLLSGSVALLALCPVAALALGPGCQLGDEYKTDKGIQNINLPLAPAEINLNQDTAVGAVVYETTLPPTPFTCKSFSGKSGPALHKGTKYDSFLSYLEKAGLKLRLKIPGKGAWVPGMPEFLAFSTPYDSDEPRTEKFPGGKLQLVVNQQMNKPIHISVPQTDDLIAIRSSDDTAGLNAITFGSDKATWINAIPECIGKTTVPDRIELGRVITGGQGSLPSPKNFYIRPSFSEGCKGFSDISTWTGFALKLDIQFEVSNTGDLTPDHTRVRLKTTGDAQDNGLQLVIKKDGATPVKFNEWEKSQSISTVNNPLNLFYSASLEPVQGGDITSAKPGEFSQQVTVKVRYE
ncbi:hypothetical protein N8J30_003387 [Salmonella enterica subsp. enterica serovar Newport]|nr:hypothetical protein [Salmonella enterica subsp. enterica serovar Newport]EJW0496298.1 hypothetical protein [Salmonella enterica subsp. enterica serovar Newport]ELA5318030.1 hypothetical protein [Salmonella enterica subsp. enterica serovar Newport]